MTTAADRYIDPPTAADASSHTLERASGPGAVLSLLKSLSYKLRSVGYGNKFYAYRLNGRHPVQLMASPDDPAPGSAVAGSALLGGQMSFGNEHVDLEDNFWQVCGTRSESFQAYAHSFHWLQDLAQVGDQTYAREIGEAIAKSWLRHFDSWDPISWQAETLARRIINWIAHAPTILSSTDLVYRSQILHSLARQSRHLMRVIADVNPGLPEVYSAAALTISGLVLPGGLHWAEKGQTALNNVMSRYIYADGGPASRNPADAIRTMQLLILVREAYNETAREVPPSVLMTLDRLGPFIRAMRHGDGTFAQFSGVSAEGGHGTDAILAASGAGGKPIENMSRSGYQRVTADRAVLLLDCGPPPATALSQKAHASTGAIEFSNGFDKIFINMGPAVDTPNLGNLEMLSRTTAAHSTLTMGDRNSSQILENGLIGKGVISTNVNREPLDTGVHLTMDHDGYLKRFGVILQRSLFLRSDGLRLTGQDQIHVESARKLKDTMGVLRFHLHPSMLATQAPDRRIVLETKSGDTWIFAAEGGHITLDDSLYMPRPDSPMATKQIVVSMEDTNGKPSHLCDWALEKILV
ncbi:heparinase [Kordiimonas sediminis]|uniref:Heparinase n=1 Tax=Kordiimonas sediminis TaxID=1735581 RepID=A0A919ALS4_9PROT|nr:heparinase II/III family protein [Kordiimonas sediminis]GHF14960.1 heparinase [Kordiimonas sediminis]